MNDIEDVLGGAFDPNDHPGGGFDPLPVAWYPVEIENAELAPTKKRDGTKLEVEMIVLTGIHMGRKLWARINIVNPSEKATVIGLQELAMLGKALGLSKVTGTDQLIGQRLQVKVKINQDKGFDPSNEITNYKPLTGETATPPPLPVTGEGSDQDQVKAPVDTGPKKEGPATAAPKPKRIWER